MTRRIFAGFIVLFLALTGDLYRELSLVHDRMRYNEMIRTLMDGRDIPVDLLVHAPLEVRLARAIYLHKKHRFEDALATLNLILDKGNAAFQSKVLFNLGNLYLTRAIEMVEQFDIGQAVPLVELAKDTYSRALRIESEYWDAKYNLELAMRLVPEVERIRRTPEDEQSRKEAPFTTVPGFPRGLP